MIYGFNDSPDEKKNNVGRNLSWLLFGLFLGVIVMRLCDTAKGQETEQPRVAPYSEFIVEVVEPPHRFQNLRDFFTRRIVDAPRRKKYAYKGVVVDERPSRWRRFSYYKVMTVLVKYQSYRDELYVDGQHARIIAMDPQTRIAIVEVLMHRPKRVLKGRRIKRDEPISFWRGRRWMTSVIVERDGVELKIENKFGITNMDLLPGTPVYQNREVVGFVWSVDNLYIRIHQAVGDERDDKK